MMDDQKIIVLVGTRPGRWGDKTLTGEAAMLRDASIAIWLRAQTVQEKRIVSASAVRESLFLNDKLDGVRGSTLTSARKVIAALDGVGNFDTSDNRVAVKFGAMLGALETDSLIDAATRAEIQALGSIAGPAVSATYNARHVARLRQMRVA